MAATGEDGHALDLAEVEAELRARQADVSARIAALTKPPEGGSGVQFGKRVGDGTTEAISRFTDVGVANDLDKISERIERALAKLAEGPTDECDGCGGPIAMGQAAGRARERALRRVRPRRALAGALDPVDRRLCLGGELGAVEVDAGRQLEVHLSEASSRTLAPGPAPKSSTCPPRERSAVTKCR